MQAKDIRSEIRKTIQSLTTTGPILKGSVSKVILGKKSRTRGHRVSYLLTYKGARNKTKTVYIQKTRLQEVQTMLRNYKNLKTAINKLFKLSVQGFKTGQTLM